MMNLLLQQYHKALTSRLSAAHKGTYGRLLILAGSKGMAGAAYLSGLAAFRMGVGMVKYYGPEENRVILQTLLPEAMYESSEFCGSAFGDAERETAAFHPSALAKSIDWADMLIIGPGLSQSAEAAAMLSALFTEPLIGKLREKRLIIFDADALNLMAANRLEPGTLALSGRPVAESAKNTEALPNADGVETSSSAFPVVVLTPHIMEMIRLLRADGISMSVEELKQDPERIAAAYAARHGVQLILKDAESVVALSDGRSFRITSGSPAMAKAGSGDVLTGYLAGTSALLYAGVASKLHDNAVRKEDLSAASVNPSGTALKERDAAKLRKSLLDAVVIGTHLHGLAGTLAAAETGVHSLLARDIADAAGKALKSL